MTTATTSPVQTNAEIARAYREQKAKRAKRAANSEPPLTERRSGHAMRPRICLSMDKRS